MNNRVYSGIPQTADCLKHTCIRKLDGAPLLHDSMTESLTNKNVWLQGFERIWHDEYDQMREFVASKDLPLNELVIYIGQFQRVS